MTASPSILGGAPPHPASPAASTVTQEERLLAAAGYLGYFTGFWLVVPIVIYVLKRETSRFVAHHALRAVILHVVAIPVFVVSWVLGTALSFGLAAAMDSGGRGSHGLAETGFMLVWLCGWIVPWLMYLVVCALAAVRAFQGRMATTSLLGRLVERFLGEDKTVARTQGG